MELVEERRLDDDVLLDTLPHDDAEPILLEQVTQLVAVDEFDGWRTVAGGLVLGVRG